MNTTDNQSKSSTPNDDQAIRLFYAWRREFNDEILDPVKP